MSEYELPTEHILDTLNIPLTYDSTEDKWMYLCFKAVKRRDKDKLKSLIVGGFYNKNFTTKYGANILHYAIYYNFLDEVMRLLRNINIPNSKLVVGDNSYTPLELAILLGKEEYVEILNSL